MIDAGGDAAPFAIDIHDIRRAMAVLRGVVRETPLIEDHRLPEAHGGRILIKAEGLQREGSFKLRGAYNRLAAIAADRRDRGVVAWSSGNHAQGVALAARLLGMPATIVMPADAPRVKADNTGALGAEILFYDRRTESREAIAHALVAERGATLVPSYDDPHVIAGQGTLGLEILEQAARAEARIDQLLVCCGGGGLVAGCAVAMRAADPAIRVYAVEPAAFDDTRRSLERGERVANPPDAAGICDALMAPEPGALTFPINRALLSGALSVTDDEVRAAMRYAFATHGLVAEPGGAVALAAVLAGKIALAGLVTVVVISGSNVDPEAFAAILTAAGKDTLGCGRQR